jgi:2-dehydropantoate 2-reductase
MKIAIIGSGAMGCRFGVAFADAGAEVWLYDVWLEHVDNISRNGLIVEDGLGGERVLKMNAVNIISKIPISDVVIIFTKSMFTKDAITKALPIIGEKTVIVTLQNGLGNIEAIQDVTGGKSVIAGVTNYASDLLNPGRVELKGSGVTKMMALDAAASEMAQTLKNMLNKTGHNAKISNDVLVDIWEKVAFNAALNSTTAITGLSVGKAGSIPESKKLLFEIASEVTTVANASGVAASEQHVHEMIASVFDPKMSGDHKTSMLQDRLLKRKTEIEAVCGRAIAIGKEHQIPTPKLECMYALVRVVEENYNSICF